MTAVVELWGVSRKYEGPPETVALRDCTLRVSEGDFVTVVGRSGSGKSTLLNIVGLLDAPTSGEYFLRGQNMTAVGESRRARERGQAIGFVFQSFQLLEHRTCVENVMLSDLYGGISQQDSRNAATAALHSVGLGDRLESRPTELSGGERQRVAIARALSGRPAILLCDEPTGNLDSRTAETILQLIHSLNREGATIMLVTHDPGIAQLGNRQIAILDGRVADVTEQSSSV
jgi:putative ABC transport system ATP-binding protein